MRGLCHRQRREGFCTVWESRTGLGLLDVDVEAMAKALWQTGAVLLRRFQLSAQDFEVLSQVLSHQFLVDRGQTRLPLPHLQEGTRQVTAPTPHAPFGLHAELATTAQVRPALIWFYCVRPPSSGGETLVCDGLEAYRRLSEEARDVFTPTLRVQHSGRPLVPVLTWIPWKSAWAFANGVVSHPSYERTKQRVRLADGRALPRSVFEAAVHATNAATEAISWQPMDTLVIDNWRCMHGRNAFTAGDPRTLYVRVARHIQPALTPAQVLGKSTTWDASRGEQRQL